MDINKKDLNCIFSIEDEMLYNIINAPIPSTKIRWLYDFISPFYEYITRYEREAKEKGISIADIKPGSKVLDVAVGTGQTLHELLKIIGQYGVVCGIDLSTKMLKTTKNRVLDAAVVTRSHLTLGDAHRLPYREEMFDVVFNSYMLDLIDTPEIPLILDEFKRVLKPGGRLVVVSLSKGLNWYSNMKLYEWVYQFCPTLFGGCRPIFSKPFMEDLGFENINREFLLVGRMMPSEIVSGDKPNSR
jgi:demethylmenaquinone methyltransferase/2-methoxy-6-polyprenyl-1,4-benzoquinol methylase